MLFIELSEQPLKPTVVRNVTDPETHFVLEQSIYMSLLSV